MEFKHTSVLLEECINGLNIVPEGIYVDGTLGGAGHSYSICQKLSSKGLLIGIDQDAMAIEAATNKLAPFSDRIKIVRDNYVSIGHILQTLEIKQVNGILLDLGVSSYQLDTAERGFSYMQDAPLDMRMDQRQQKTAKEIVNHYSDKDLFRILNGYGEERFANNIIRNILRARQEKEIETTLELVDIVSKSIPAKFKATGGHPAKRTFQAIRIELNEELTVLRESIHQMIDVLGDGGRLCIITFHSLEDRIVKQMFRESEGACSCPQDFPVCICGFQSKGSVITKKPILPSEEELEGNSRSKSAKLRIFERGVTRNHE
ncbi:MAG: 16S rRNA (cytosine(1402)-N(4))-methyltransferase RsmH [Vallitaleaceae bacterium]|nr:16S rRNA (cytosine(1402)-N(4))-methyltransferase RsmH [Vallitaleaceae bacterium]